MSLKKKVSRMQIEADAEPNFLIIMLNNVQDPNASNPSQSAGKYLTNGEGAIKETFLSEGLQLDKSYYLLANNKNFSFDKEGAKNEDKLIKASPTQIQNKTSSLKFLRRQSSHAMQRVPLISSHEKLRLQELLSTRPRT